jgi:predicted phosphodiesterase
MKLVIISDTHSLQGTMLNPVPDGDVLIHCGDVCNRGTINDFLDFLAWFSTFPHETKIFIAGNHDFALQDQSDPVKHALADLDLSGTGIHYLQDSGLTIQNGDEAPVNFWGTPWTPEFYNWAFMKKRGNEMAEVWAKVPDNTNVLITHGPPMTKTFLDYAVYGAVNVGCEEQAKRITELKDLKINCFGHIHEGYGLTETAEGVQLINASVCTLRYQPWNKPIEIEI